MKEEILARLDPKTRARLEVASELQLERLPTPSLGLNLALNGGLVAGRQVLFWGNKSAGKTAVALEMIALAQKAGKTCALIDAEQSCDPDWTARLGVNNDDLIISHSRGVGKVADECVDLTKAGTDIIVLDSLSQVLPASYFNDDELKNFDDTNQLGQLSKDMGKLSNMVGSVNEKTLFIIISQQRNHITKMFTKMAPMGGEAMKFNSSTVIKFWSSESDNNAIMGEAIRGDKIIKDKVGRTVTWEVEWNKTGPMWRTGKYDFYFSGEKVGIDQASELVTLGLEAGIIKQSGSWLDLGFAKVQGIPKAAALLREDPDNFKLFADTIEAGYVQS